MKIFKILQELVGDWGLIYGRFNDEELLLAMNSSDGVSSSENQTIWITSHEMRTTNRWKWASLLSIAHVYSRRRRPHVFQMRWNAFRPEWLLGPKLRLFSWNKFLKSHFHVKSSIFCWKWAFFSVWTCLKQMNVCARNRHSSMQMNIYHHYHNFLAA